VTAGTFRHTDAALLDLPLSVPFMVAARAHYLSHNTAYAMRSAKTLPFGLLALGERTHVALVADLIGHFGADPRVLDLIEPTDGLTLRDLLSEPRAALPVGRAGAYFGRHESAARRLHRRDQLPFPTVPYGKTERVPVYGLLQLAGHTPEAIARLREITAAKKAA
jgi:hypothetical protein